MNFKGKHIGSVFTFLAGLIILAHAVVAHHHHFELSHSPEKESSCESVPQEKNTEIPDCHAFNILVSGKSTIFSLKNSLSEYFSFYLIGLNSNIEIPLVKKVTTTLFGQQTIFIKHYFVTAQSLRGPPAYT